MRVLSLFSGGGLGDYGLELAGMEIVGQVEIDDYCQKILKLRWPDVPKWGDIKSVTGKEIIERCGTVELISGGFPCQDISVAKFDSAQGVKGERSGLWFEFQRLISEIRPRYAIMENSPIITKRGLSEVVGSLAEIGYDIEWHVIPARSFGAPHLRKRWWGLAYPSSLRQQAANDETFVPKETLHQTSARKFSGTICSQTRFASEPEFLRVDDGRSEWVERFKLLGNGQVVQVVEWIGKQIMKFES